MINLFKKIIKKYKEHIEYKILNSNNIKSKKIIINGKAKERKRNEGKIITSKDCLH